MEITYWNKNLETMDRSSIEALQVERLQGICRNPLAFEQCVKILVRVGIAVGKDDVFVGAEYLQAGTTAHGAAGRTQLLFIDVKRGAAMGAAGYQLRHACSESFIRRPSLSACPAAA